MAQARILQYRPNPRLMRGLHVCGKWEILQKKAAFFFTSEISYFRFEIKNPAYLPEEQARHCGLCFVLLFSHSDREDKKSLHCKTMKITKRVISLCFKKKNSHSDLCLFVICRNRDILLGPLSLILQAGSEVVVTQVSI